MKLLRKIFTAFIGISGLLLMLWFILPSVYASYTYVPVAIYSAAVSLFVIFIDRKHFFNYVKVFLPCFIIAFLYFIVPYRFTLKPAVNIFQQMLIFTVPLVLSALFIGFDENDKFYRRFYKLSAVFLVGCMVLVYVRTMSALAVDPTVCRLLAIGTYSTYRAEEVAALRMSNVGGFGFSYAMGIIEVFTFYNSVTQKRAKRAVFIILTLAILAFVIKSQYLTLLLLCIVINLLICLRFTKSDLARVIIIFVTALIVIFSSFITRGLSYLISGEKLSEKMYAISGLLGGDGYTSWRLDYIKEALTSFSRHIFFGQPDLINDHEAIRASENSHSTQLKILVDIGIFGSVAYNVFLFGLRKFMIRLINRSEQNPEVFNMIFWFLYLLSWLNPVFQIYEIPFAIFLVVPMLICIGNYENKNRKKKLG